MVKLHFSTKLLAIPFFDVIYEGRVALRRSELNPNNVKIKLENSMPHVA